MSYLDKLLEGVEVEWKPLGELGYFYGGLTGKSKDDFNDGNAKFITYKNIYSNFSLKIDIEDTVKVEENEKQNTIEYGDVLFTGSSETPDECGFSSVLTLKTNEKLYLNSFCFGFRLFDKQLFLPDFLKFLFRSVELRKQIGKTASGVTRFNVSKVKMTRIQIPIPPLPVQTEIVRILDKFSTLTATATLTAELTARKKQYNYYREQLLGLAEGDVEWKTLESLAENLDSMRKPVTSGLREAGDIPYYGASGIVDYVKDYIFDGDFLLVSEDGANLIARNTPIAFSISGKTWVNNHAHVLKFNTYAERRFVEYFLNSIDLTPYISGAAQPKLNQKNLNSIKIPNPSPEEKVKIVSILDKFDTLTSSISEGLPKEIELRKKQYGYYRDLLLTFPK